MTGIHAAPGRLQPVRILHLIVRLGCGGAPMMLYKLIRQSLERSNRSEHAVVTLLDENHLVQEFESLGIPVLTLGMRRGLPSVTAIHRLRALITQLQPQLIHGWMYHANIAASIASRSNCPVVWSIHHSLHDLSLEKPLTKALIRHGHLLQAGVARIVYCSQSSRRQHESLGYAAPKGIVIPNGFDCTEFRPNSEARVRSRAALGISMDAVIVGHLARYHPMKNHRGLIDAFAMTARRHPEAYLVMAGMGLDEHNTALVEQARGLGVEGRVRLLGVRHDVPELMNAFDLYVSASVSGEAFPVVLGEAMACSVPCVATDLGDSADIIGDTGHLVVPGDSSALSSAMTKLIECESGIRRSMGAKARQRIIDRFSLSFVEQAYSRLYEESITIAGN